MILLLAIFFFIVLGKIKGLCCLDRREGASPIKQRGTIFIDYQITFLGPTGGHTLLDNSYLASSASSLSQLLQLYYRLLTLSKTVFSFLAYRFRFLRYIVSLRRGILWLTPFNGISFHRLTCARYRKRIVLHNATRLGLRSPDGEWVTIGSSKAC